MKKSIWQRLSAKPWLRAQLCSAVMGSTLLVGGVAYASHRAKETALRLGSEIMTSAGPSQKGASIYFNGAHFFFDTQVLNSKLEDVMAGAQAICQKEGEDLVHDLGPRFDSLPADIASKALLSQLDVSKALTVSTDSNGNSGEVACWVRRSQGPKKTMFERAKSFAQSFDLSEFGSLQFIHAERHGNRTLVRMLWSEGSLSLNDLFPEKKDTPGHDLTDLPRPVGSIRIIAAHVEGAGRHVVGYESHQTPEQLNAFYARELSALGWQEIDLGERPDGEPPLQHAYQRGERHALLALTVGEEVTGATWLEVPTQ